MYQRSLQLCTWRWRVEVKEVRSPGSLSFSCIQPPKISLAKLIWHEMAFWQEQLQTRHFRWTRMYFRAAIFVRHTQTHTWIHMDSMEVADLLSFWREFISQSQVITEIVRLWKRSDTAQLCGRFDGAFDWSCCDPFRLFAKRLTSAKWFGPLGTKGINLVRLVCMCNMIIWCIFLDIFCIIFFHSATNAVVSKRSP